VRNHDKDYGEKEARETSLASNASKVVTAKDEAHAHASSSSSHASSSASKVVTAKDEAHAHASSSEKDSHEMALAPRTSKASKKVAPHDPTVIQHAAQSSHAKAQKDSHVEAKEGLKSIVVAKVKDVHRVERGIQNGAMNNAALAPSTAIQHAALTPSLNWAQTHHNTLLWAKKLGAKALVGPH
jgi:hypothetical protein